MTLEDSERQFKIMALGCVPMLQLAKELEETAILYRIIDQSSSS